VTDYKRADGGSNGQSASDSSKTDSAKSDGGETKPAAKTEKPEKKEPAPAAAAS
jgi:hypothetical protein